MNLHIVGAAPAYCSDVRVSKEMVRAPMCSKEAPKGTPLTQSTNLTVKTALVTGSLVFVDQTFTGHVIENRHCFFICSLSSAFVTAGDSCKYTLYHGAHHGSMAGVALTGFFGLANAFARLSCVGHGLSSNWSLPNQAAHYPPALAYRQRQEH